MKGQQRKIMLKVIIVLLVIIIVDSIAPFITSNANVFAAVTEWVGKGIFESISHFLASIADAVIQKLEEIFVGDNLRTIKMQESLQIINIVYYIRYSPGIIFSGTVPGLDVNFINPMEDYKVTTVNYKTLSQKKLDVKTTNKDDKEDYYQKYDEAVEDLIQQILLDFGYINVNHEERELIDKICDEINWTATSGNIYKIKGIEYRVQHYTGDAGCNSIIMIEAYDSADYIIDINYVNREQQDINAAKSEFKQKLYLFFDMESESKIENNVHTEELRHLLNSKKNDFWKEINEPNRKTSTLKREITYSTDGQDIKIHFIYDGSLHSGRFFRFAYILYEETGQVIESSAKKLQKTIATWYNVMKDIALVGLLSVLVYVSIRMIISSSTEDKAKYKKMIADWVAAICIIYLLHYFMSLVLTVSQALSDVFNASIIGETGEDILMSSIRTKIEAGQSFVGEFANIIIYLVLVILTVMFTYQYLKRFIYVAFLTMVAPLIALTYPLDKIKDGKAQAYTTWLREYLFTVLIQVIHLIIYYVLVGATNDLIDGSNPQVYNPIFAIVAISFILPAEKFIRNMFGFNKAEATNTIGSAFGGAALMKAINKLGKNAPKDSKDKAKEAKGGDGKVRTANQGIDSGVTPESLENQQGSKWDGAKNVAKKYVFNKENGKKLLRGAGKVAGAGVLGTAGLAAGIATGEMENAVAGATGGMAAGSRVGGNLVDGGANLISGASAGLQGMKDAFGQGRYGEEAYAKMQQNEAFRNSADYSKLTSKYQGQEGDIEEFLNAGVTDAGKMDIAMQSIKDGKYNAQDAINYMKMAEQCPAEILYDKENFKTFVTTLGYPEGEAEKLRKGIADFK